MTTLAIALQLVTLLLVVVVLVLVLGIFHKVRKVHLASYRVLEDATAIRHETQALFPQLQALSALEKILRLSAPLPSLRGWAGSPDFLLTVAETVLSHRPAIVLECSSGVSTVAIARCLQINNLGHVYSLEQDAEYASKTMTLLAHYGVSDRATVLHAPLVEIEHGMLWYDLALLPGEVGPIDLLVVDGPPCNTGPLARLPALPILLPQLASSVVVIMDDAARNDEVQIVKRWRDMAPEFRETYLDHEKGCVVLTRGSQAV